MGNSLSFAVDALRPEEHRQGFCEPEHCNESIPGGISLGWLYLAVIGLPSILWASRPRRNYFSFWTERWADTLGGIQR